MARSLRGQLEQNYKKSSCECLHLLDGFADCIPLPLLFRPRTLHLTHKRTQQKKTKQESRWDGMKLEPTLVDCLFDAAGDAAETAGLTLEVYGGTFQVGEGTCSLARALPRFLLEVDNVAVEVAAAYGVEQTCGQNGVLRGISGAEGPGCVWQVHCTRFTLRTRRWLGAKEIVALVRVENCRIRRIRKAPSESNKQTNGTFLQRLCVQKPYEWQLEVVVLEQRVALVSSAPPRRALEEVVL